MPEITVFNRETGFTETIQSEEYDPERYELQSQVAAVAPTEGTFAGQEVTEQGLADLYVDVTPEQRVERSREAVVEQYDTTGNTLAQFGRGVADGITFDLFSTATAPEDPYALERAGYKREAAPRAYLAGQLTGAIAPGLVSGGTGTIGALARLTPAGRLSAATGRLAARGGIARGAAGGFIEGAAAAGGDYVARVALDEDAEFSASAMLGAAAQGGLLGAGIGGVAELASGGIGRLVRRRAARAEAERLGQLGAARPGILDTKPGKRSSYKRVVRRELAENNADVARQLERRIDDAATSGTAQRVRGLRDDPDLARLAQEDEEVARLLERADELAQGFDDAAGRAKGAWSRYADDVGLSQAKQRITREASDEVEDAVATTIAETEETGRRLADVYDELAARTGRELPPLGIVGRTSGEAATKAGLDISALAKARGMAGRAWKTATGDRVAGALGVAELAGTAAGLPTTSDIPVVGDAMGLYLKYKGATAALRGVGALPATRAVRAAERVQGLRERVSDSVRAFATRAARKAAPHRPAATMAAAKAAAIVSELGQVNGQDVENQVRQELQDTTSGVAEASALQARAAVEYLQRTAPRDPLPHRPPHLSKWRPAEHEAAVFARRVRSVADPAYAAARVLESALSAIELDALAAVHPAVLQALRSDVMANADEIAKKRDHDAVRSLGYRLGLPLTVETAFGARAPVENQPAMPPETSLNLPGPSTPGASPAVEAERVGVGR